HLKALGLVNVQQRDVATRYSPQEAFVEVTRLKEEIWQPMVLPQSDRAEVTALADTGKPTPKRKRSTERGEGQAKCIAELTKQHEYSDGSCLNSEPIGVNELARLAGVSVATASAFFKGRFKGHLKYRAVCRDAGRLADSLKALNGEFSPHELYGRRPPDE